MNVFKIRNNVTGEYFSKSVWRKGKRDIKWAKVGQVWSTMSGPRQVFKICELKGQASIVEFELVELREDRK